MGSVIGRGRNARETYPEGSAGAAGAASAALRNRNVTGSTALTVPFTPSNSVIAAILFTPRVSGVLQISATLLVQNGAGADDFTAVMEAVPGTGLTVTGGETTTDGWVMGSATPPVVGGVTGVPSLVLEGFDTLGANANGSFTLYGISNPMTVGEPMVALVLITESGGGHALDQLVIANLSITELP